MHFRMTLKLIDSVKKDILLPLKLGSAKQNKTKQNLTRK